MRAKVLSVLILLAFSILVPVTFADAIDVYPGDSIQAAIDSASPGDTIFVHEGVYHQSVVITTDDITLEGEDGTILDGSGTADPGTTLTVDAIRLGTGVSGVIIAGFEICFYTGTGNGQGNGIQAWNDGTSDITIENNVIHDNSWNAILVGNEGTGLHTSWVIENNEVYDNGFYSIEITNGEGCKITDNTVVGGYTGILVQARNTIPKSGLFTASDITVEENEISGAVIGVYILSLASGPTPPFDPITGAWALLEDVKVSENDVHDNIQFGIYVWGYLAGMVEGAVIEGNEVEGIATSYHGIVFNNVDESSISENEVADNGYDGIALYGASTSNEVEENKVENNGRYGISVRGDSSDTLVEENEVSGSGSFDLHWDGTGDGNVWEENEYGTKTDNIVQEDD